MTHLVKSTTQQYFHKIINRAKLAESSKARYVTAIDKALAAKVDISNRESLLTYASGLSASGKSHLKATIRLLTSEYAQQLKSSANGDNIDQVQARLLQLEAIANTIEVETPEGQKVHTWLSQTEVKQLLSAVNSLRDKVVIGLLVGAGLRREELINLTFADVIVKQPNGKKRVVLAVKGKGAKDREVPINDKLADLIKQWHGIVGDGLIARSITKGGIIGNGLTAIGVFQIVRKCGQHIGKPELAPHDLRRTYAQLGYEAGVPITQISTLLGHSSINTTQRYLKLDLDLKVTISDFIPF